MQGENRVQMTQAEIDALVGNHLDGKTPEYTEAESIKIKERYHTLLSMKTRLEFARSNLSFHGQREAAKAVHSAAFGLWLANRRMTKQEYYRLVNKELEKRGFPRISGT